MELKLLFFAGLGLAVLLTVIYFLRVFKMEQKYSLLWLVMGVAVFLTPLLYPVWGRLAGKLGLADPNLVVLVLGIIGLFLLCMQFSLELSRSYRERKTLAQQVALLSQRLETLEKTAGSKKAGEE
ncbi:MAG: DUF2304 domain-containing protein [Candidatus Glassbacteria bacterium]|nr:DUF2304 domain-containing protein [Candidatus Glassbacteria bacterium]